MAQLPTIREIANELYATENIDFTGYDAQAEGTSDDYDGYTNCYVSRHGVEYTNGSETLEIAEVIGEKVDENGEPTGEEVTLDYLWSTLIKWEDGTSTLTDTDGGPSPEKLKQVIRDFMA